MMKRLLWLGVGLAVGAIAVRLVTKKAQSYTPSGIAAGVRDSGRNALDSVRDFVDDVRDAMQEREQELHAALADGRGFDDETAESAGAAGAAGAAGFELPPPDRSAEDTIR